MTRWSALGRHPEHVQVVWDPDRWILPAPWEELALLAALAAVTPGAALLFAGRRSSGVVVIAGFLWAVTSALLTFVWRKSLRCRRARRARGNDWVCAACLHTEPSADLPMTIG